MNSLSCRDLYLPRFTEVVSITVIASNVLLEHLKKHQSEYPIRWTKQQLNDANPHMIYEIWLSCKKYCYTIKCRILPLDMPQLNPKQSQGWFLQQTISFFFLYKYR